MHTTTKYFKYQSQIPIANIVVTRLVKSENQKIANLYLKNKFKTDYIDGSLMEINKVTQQDFETRYCVGLRKAVKLFIDGNFAKTKTLKDCEVNGDQIYAIIKAHLTPFLKIELGHISTLWYPNDMI